MRNAGRRELQGARLSSTSVRRMDAWPRCDSAGFSSPPSNYDGWILDFWGTSFGEVEVELNVPRPGRGRRGGGQEMHGGLSARASAAAEDWYHCARLFWLGRMSHSLFWHGSQTDERIHESMSIGGKRAVEGLRQLQATYGLMSVNELCSAVTGISDVRRYSLFLESLSLKISPWSRARSQYMDEPVWKDDSRLLASWFCV